MYKKFLVLYGICLAILVFLVDYLVAIIRQLYLL